MSMMDYKDCFIVNGLTGGPAIGLLMLLVDYLGLSVGATLIVLLALNVALAAMLLRGLPACGW